MGPKGRMEISRMGGPLAGRRFQSVLPVNMNIIASFVNLSRFIEYSNDGSIYGGISFRPQKWLEKFRILLRLGKHKIYSNRKITFRHVFLQIFQLCSAK